MFIEADTATIVEQVGMPTVLAISGGRVEHRETGITLPVSNGYRVTIDLAAGDTYTVRRIFERAGKTWIKGEVENVYADAVGTAAYEAANFRSYPFPRHCNHHDDQPEREITDPPDPGEYSGPGSDTRWRDVIASTGNEPTIEQFVEFDAQRKREIAIERAGHVMTMIHDDQRRGVVPDAVASFGQLHDYVDANDYLIQTLAVYFADQRAAAEAADAEVITSDAETDLANMISDIVDDRLHKHALAIINAGDVEPETREAFEQALADRYDDPQYAVHVYPPSMFDPDGPDRNGAFDGFQVISDADEGL